MPRNASTHTTSQPAADRSADGRGARTEAVERVRSFTTRRESDSLIERIVLEHARSLRPSRGPRPHARVAHAGMLDNFAHRC